MRLLTTEAMLCSIQRLRPAGVCFGSGLLPALREERLSTETLAGATGLEPLDVALSETLGR